MRSRFGVLSGLAIVIGLVVASFVMGGTSRVSEGSPAEEGADASPAPFTGAAKAEARQRPAEAPWAAVEHAADIRSLQSNELARLMESVRSKGPGLEVRATLERDPAGAVELLASYANDRSKRVRQRANAMSAQFVLEHGSVAERMKVVDQLAAALDDPASTVFQHAAQDLLRFDREDFSRYARSELVRLLGEPEPKPSAIRLVGLAGLESEMARLAELRDGEGMSPSMLASARYYGGVEWAATLARARLGSQADAAFAIERVKAEQNPSLRVADLLRQVAYTRQLDAIEYVSEYLNSDEKLPGSKPGSGMPYSQHALDILAGEIGGFPVPKDQAGTYNDEDIEKARKFMAARSNWAGALAN